MKILMILEHFYPYKGGVEFLFLHLAEQLVKQGHKVKVITTLHDKSLPIYEQISGVDVQRVKCKNRFLFSFFSIRAILSNAKHFDILQTTTYNAAFPTWICGLITRKKTVITFHEFWGTLWKRLPYLSTLERVFFRTYEKLVSLFKYDKVVAVSDYTRNSLIESGVPESRIVRIYNGLDYQEINDIKYRLQADNSMKYQGDPYVLFVGRIGVSKGFDLLIPGMDQFLSNHSKFLCRLVIPTYPAKLYNKIKSQLDQMLNKNRVLITGNLSRDELYNSIVNARCVVIPSYSEGFCFVAAETQALGTPVISSDQGALQEVVNHQYIKMKNMSTFGLSEALEKMARDEWEHGSGLMFDQSVTVDSYINLYKQLLSDS